MARIQAGKWPHQFGTGEDTPDYFNRVLSFLERNIQSYQLNGQHYFENFVNLTTDWSVTIAKTNQDEPDRRMLASLTFTIPDTNNIIKGSNWDQPSRYYRFLEDKKTLII